MLPDLMHMRVCATVLLILMSSESPQTSVMFEGGRGIVKTLNFIQPKSCSRANIIVWCKVLSNPQQETAWSCSVSIPSLFGVATGTLLCVEGVVSGFRLDIRENIFTEKVVQPWHSPRVPIPGAI